MVGVKRCLLSAQSGVTIAALAFTSTTTTAMPPVTKRTKVTQSNTLLGFFSTPTSVSPSKSGSSTSPSKPTRTQGKQRVRAAPAEVIVIDSDSDCELNEDPAKISGGKRKRASAHTQIVLDDDEVQIVGPPSSKIEAKSPIIKAESKPSSASKTLEQPAPATPTTGSSVNIEGAHPSAMDLDFTLSRCIATSSKVKLEAFQDDERLIELSDWSDAEDTYTPGGHLQDLDDQPEDDKAEILEVVKPEISEVSHSVPLFGSSLMICAFKVASLCSSYTRQQCVLCDHVR